MSPNHRLIGLALGSGSARGLSHIGVLRALQDMGIEPDIVCGTSMGALVGAAYVSNHLDTLESWVRSFDRIDIARYLDIKLIAGGGFADARRLLRYCRKHFGDPTIEELSTPFVAVATNLESGHEVWLREGSLWDAVRASIAIPGLLTPTQMNNHWQVDGSLVNPVPVSVCRALGAEIVIAVNPSGTLNTQVSRPINPDMDITSIESAELSLLEKLSSGLKERASTFWSQQKNETIKSPGLFDVVSNSLNIVQDRIMRSRMAGDPPDIVLSPRAAHIGLLEFDRAAEAIEAGRDAVNISLEALHELANIK